MNFSPASMEGVIKYVHRSVQAIARNVHFTEKYQIPAKGYTKKPGSA